VRTRTMRTQRTSRTSTARTSRTMRTVRTLCYSTNLKVPNLSGLWKLPAPTGAHAL
jgi:hypothetical protein